MARRFAFAFLGILLVAGCGAERPADPSKDGKAAAPPPQVETALALKREVETANRRDLKVLHDELQARFAKWTAEEGRLFLAALGSRLAGDGKVFREIRKKILADKALAKEASYELKTSLVKLVGIEDETGRVVQSGILDDAQAMLRRPPATNPLFTDPEKLDLRKNQITVAKTLLLYGRVVAEGAPDVSTLVEGGLEKKVRMLYRTPLPKGLGDELLGGSVLACRKEALLVPNAGYVYGGNFVGGQCRGVDCSAFVSRCVESRVRMSTVYLDFLWREIVEGEKGFSKEELPIRAELLREWKLAESKKDFRAIDAATPLESGDLVTWRPAGHTVIVLGSVPGSPNDFVAIEANRADEKTKEGIEINVFERARPGQRTTVLRRVWSGRPGHALADK